MGRVWRIVGIVSPNPLEILVKFKQWFSFLLILLSGAVLPAWATESASHPDPAMELDRMDQRTPVPLSPHMALHQKQNMRDHLEAIQAIIAGLAKQDFPAIEAAAARMGFSKEMEGMCQRMGAALLDFQTAPSNSTKPPMKLRFMRERRTSRVYWTASTEPLRNASVATPPTDSKSSLRAHPAH